MIIRTSEISSQSFRLKWIIESNMHFKQVFKAYCAYIVLLVSIRFVILRSDFRFRTVSTEGLGLSTTAIRPVGTTNDNFQQFGNERTQRRSQYYILEAYWLTRPEPTLISGSLKQQPRQRLWKRHLNNEVALPKTLSRLFQLVQFVKCWQFFLELNSKRLDRSSEKDGRKSLPRVHVLHKTWN